MKTCPVCDTPFPDQHSTCPTDGAVLIESREFEPGHIVRGKYRIIRKLGQGGMGVVYLAEHLMLGGQLALKFLSTELCRSPQFVKRFRNEARAAYQLRHPNIIEVSDLDQDEEGSLFIAMEYVAGPSLRLMMSRMSGPLPVPRALEIVRGIAAGLAAAHLRGAVHRDIKPENILLATDPGGQLQPKVLDFGIAAMTESATHLSQTRGLLLTPEYAAPEQWRGMLAAELDGRTDLYALGGIFYEMLSGRTPFWAANPEGWMYQHLQGVPEPLNALRPDLAREYPALESLVMRLLARDRDQRPASAAEVVSDIDDLTRAGTPLSVVASESTPNLPANAAARLQSETASPSAARAQKGGEVISTHPSSVLFALGAAGISLTDPEEPTDGGLSEVKRSRLSRMLGVFRSGWPKIFAIALGALFAIYSAIAWIAGIGLVLWLASLVSILLLLITAACWSALWSKRGVYRVPAILMSLLLGLPAVLVVIGAWDPIMMYFGDASGDGNAACNLGQAYSAGSNGFAQNLSRGLHFYEKACQLGRFEGCIDAAFDYRFGYVVTRDWSRAAALYTTACVGGFADGCSDLDYLGDAYKDGDGVEKDLTHAAALYQKACNGGNHPACDSLSAMHSEQSSVQHVVDGASAKSTVYRVGGEISAPVLLNNVEAEYSEEARHAKYQGVCVIQLTVDANGLPQHVRVVRPLGMGLDEKALEAVRRYRFRPAMKDGKTPVPVAIKVEVNFRLY